MSLTVSVDVKQHWIVLRHWSQFVPSMSTSIRGHEALLHHLQALVTPILKKPSLDANDLRNFRPVSNLPFVSKILERVVFLSCSLICAQTAYSNSTVCVQKISQYRNCCFECTRRPPYKVWSETCVSTCTVGSECRFWHPWPCHPIKTTWEQFWNHGSTAVLVWIMPKW